MTTRLLTLRRGLLVALLLCLYPPHLLAQSNMGSIQSNPALSSEAEVQVDPLGWEAPVRFKSGAFREVGTSPHSLAAVRSSEGGTVPTSRWPGRLAAGWLNRTASHEVARLNLAAAYTDSALLRVQQSGAHSHSWIGRHPVLFGTLVGFGSGFLVGYLPGDDGVFDDYAASFNGLVLGGVGAGTGALVGAIVGAAKK